MPPSTDALGRSRRRLSIWYRAPQSPRRSASSASADNLSHKSVSHCFIVCFVVSLAASRSALAVATSSGVLVGSTAQLSQVPFARACASSMLSMASPRPSSQGLTCLGSVSPTISTAVSFVIRQMVLHVTGCGVAANFCLTAAAYRPRSRCASGDGPFILNTSGLPPRFLRSLRLGPSSQSGVSLNTSSTGQWSVRPDHVPGRSLRQLGLSSCNVRTRRTSRRSFR